MWPMQRQEAGGMKLTEGYVEINPVAHDYGLRSTEHGLLRGIVPCQFGLLG